MPTERRTLRKPRDEAAKMHPKQATLQQMSRGKETKKNWMQLGVYISI